ncbi:unnamed protein product, partial [marine sediment metagenome]
RRDEFRRDPRLLVKISHAEDRKAVARHLRECGKRGGAASVSFRIITRKGRERWIEHICQPVHGAGGRNLGRRASNRDITERKRLERDILRIGEWERQRIGLDIHDHVCQDLMAARMLLAAKTSDPAGIDDILRRTLERARGLAKDLYPVDIDVGGIVSALRALASEKERLYGVACRLKPVGPLPDVDRETATHLYRIAQEALSNALRHAKARSIAISLAGRKDGTVVLRVKDDGTGIPKSPKRAGMGLGI